MYYAPLPQRGLIRIFGEDTVPFLQGLVSNDVTKLEPGGALYAALLSPQGKYLHDFFLTDSGQGIVLDCEKDRLEDLAKRLSLYKLRSKVAIESLPEAQGVVALWGEAEAPARGVADPRLPELGWRITGDTTETQNWCEAQGYTYGDYDRHRLAMGVPDGSRDMTPDRSLLLECGFEELHGVDFAKGCYVGQEVTARSKFRAQLRKFLYQVKAVSGELPETGTPVMAGDAVIGEMRSHCGNMGLALIRSEELDKARDAVLRAGGAEITVAFPSWRISGISVA